MRKTLLAVSLLGASAGARAEWLFSLVPARGSEGTSIALRVEDTDSHCFPAAAPNVVREGDRVLVRFEIEDFIPSGTPPGTCPAYRVTPREHSLGPFARGRYEVQVTTCSNPTPPTPPCTLRATLPLVVNARAPAPFTVPALSGPAALAAALALLVTALGRRRG